MEEIVGKLKCVFGEHTWVSLSESPGCNWKACKYCRIIVGKRTGLKFGVFEVIRFDHPVVIYGKLSKRYLRAIGKENYIESWAEVTEEEVRFL